MNNRMSASPSGSEPWRGPWRSRFDWGLRVAVLAACVVTLGLQAWSWLTIPQLTGSELLLFAAMTLLAVLFLLYCLREVYVERVELELSRTRELEELNSSIIRTLALAINSKDRMSQGHIERVQQSALAIAREMNVQPSDLEELRIAALLHDVGKLAVPEHILNKPDRLTKEEQRKVQSHTRVGRRMLEPIKFPGDVVRIVEHHHECFDGSGYPGGLQGVEIPLGARILAVANVYDALVSQRPYRPAMSPDQALAHIESKSATDFDPEVVAAFMRLAAAGALKRTYRFTIAAPAAAQAAGPDSIHDDIARAREELVALYDIVQTMSTTLNVQEALGLVASKTESIVGYSTCIVFFVDQERKAIRAEFVRGEREKELAGMTIPMGEGVSGRVASGGMPVRSEDAGRDLEWAQPGPSGGVLHSVLAVPLMREREVIGVLSVYHTAKQAFTEDHQRLLAIVARQASLAIENARQFARTRESALTDSLTGLPNARSLYTLLEQEISRSRRHNEPLSLLALDLDDFKSINDTFGHQVGDQALRDIATIFVRALREYDTVARHAGDEFFIVLPSTGREQALAIAGRTQAAVASHHLDFQHGTMIRLRVSIGVATFPDDGQDMHSLIAVADAAMYEDKRANQQRIAVLPRPG